ncbi:MAG TPA: hypothetical protein VNW46_01085 [Gemmatimonadaceae bacterium]|nr:hypothetical protein [Gemmatimonadaceae bacterium]
MGSSARQQFITLAVLGFTAIRAAGAQGPSAVPPATATATIAGTVTDSIHGQP